MAELTDYVNLVIQADSVSPTRAGFGTPGIVSHAAAFPERSRIYTSLAQLLSDGFESDGPEARMVGRVFGQTPRPRRVKILRASTEVTMVYALSILDDTRALSEYSLNLSGMGFDDVTVTFTTDGSPSNDAIISGLVDALNAVVDKNFTAAIVPGAGDTDTLTITADDPNGWFSVEVVDVSAMSIAMTHGDADVDDELSAIALEDNDWYWLLTLYNSAAYMATAATWTQSQKKFYFPTSNATQDILEASDGTNGPLDALKNSGYTRTGGDYHPSPAAMADGGLIGNIASRDPGSFTAMYKQRVGVPPVVLTPSHRANLIARNANSYEEVPGGVRATFAGTTAAGPTVALGFIDVVHFLDWLDDDMSKGVFGALASAAKVPRTDEGMVVIQSEVKASLDRGIAKGGIKSDPPPVIEVPLISEMDDLLPRGVRLSFSFELAGAIHQVDPITGVVVF